MLPKWAPDAVKFIYAVTGMAILYGIAHDLVTANVCVEYFTVYHPRLVASQSAFVMAFLWGTIATWWVGVALGVLLAGANLFGRRPPLPWALLRRRVAWTVVLLWFSAMAVLSVTYWLEGTRSAAWRSAALDSDRRFLAVATTHSYSYSAAALAGLVLAVWTACARVRIAK